MSVTRTLVSETPAQVGATVLLQGWVATKRDHGKVTFIDLRDRSGIIQCVGVGKLKDLGSEDVVEVTGLVKERPENLRNSAVATGSIEIEVLEYSLLNATTTLPIDVESDGLSINEESRLKYRYIDLRRQRMQMIMRLRSRLSQLFRESLLERDFVEVETPLLTKSTKEGARDFVVPSRLQPGVFYALPQSPQQYKQLLMTAGFERYFQIARCLRDEDLRADRGFEFTQVDLEMSFVDREQIMETLETVVKKVVTAAGGKLQKQTFPVYTYAEALKQFGADRFDLRSESEKKDGTLAFAWVIDFPFFKKVDTADAAEVRDGKSGWTFTHNPFSRPLPEHIERHLKGEDIESIITTQYDLVCNGYEVGGGSIRAHEPEVLRQTFKIMGYSDREIEDSVGHMLKAFESGTPPHGGIAFGFDRLVMLLAGETSLKETIPFPMTSSGRTAVMDAPAPISQEQLDELSIKVATSTGLDPHDAILLKLHQAGVSYEYLKHAPVFTSQEAEAVRENAQLSEGAKALVLQADKQFVLAVVPGDKKLNIEALKAHLGVKKLAMASRDSVKAITGLEVGSIPPFGSVLSAQGLQTFADPAVINQPRVAFNVGRHDRSVVMAAADYQRVEQPQMVAIAQ